MKSLLVFLLLSAPTLQARNVTIYFTPNQPVDQVVLKAVGKAEHSVYLASYSYHWPELTETLRRLKLRGVDVRIFLDSPPPPREAAGLENSIRTDRRSSLFHAKYIVVDRRNLLVTSLNFTSDNFFLNHNNLLILEDAEAAGFFADKFLSWWDDRPSTARYVTPDLEAHFSPENDCSARIRAAVDAARASIHFADYDFTSEEIATAIARRRLAGVPVYGLIERSKVYPYSTFFFLRDLGARVRRSSMAGLLHDKLMIIDEATVIAGSYNPTESAKDNTECLLILKDPVVARKMLSEWRRLWFWRSLP